MTAILVSPTELADRLRASRAGRRTLVLDATVVLPRPEFDGDHRASSGYPGWLAGHVPGSRHLDLLEAFAEPGAGYHFAHPGAARATAVLTGLGVDADTDLVLYDQADGFWAARAWWTLRALSLDAQVLNGGWQAWTAAGLPVAAGEDPVPPLGTALGEAVDPGNGGTRNPGATPLALRERPELWASRDDVAAASAGRTAEVLVCALGADQFTGEGVTRYSRRGHVPGSLNLPARDLAAGPGGLLARGPAAAAAAGILPEAEQTVLLYCGGGISASFAALGLTVAGYPHVRVYDGSLEDWSTDPARPLVGGPAQ